MGEADIIRESYNKLKEKYKKESELAKEETHKRMLLEANENNYKIDLMKLKLKSEGYEKDISDKNEKIKHINTQLAELQKKDIDFAYVKEENISLENKVKIYEDTIQNLLKENE